MRKFNFLVVLVASIALMFNSCSKQETYLKSIPGTASVVGSVDVFNVSRKADLLHADQYGFYKDMMKNLKEENPKLQEVLSKITKEPLSSGIKLQKNVFFFLDKTNETEFVGISAALRSESKFENSVKKILEVSKIKNVDIKSKDGYSYLLIEKGVIAFDKNRVLLAFSKRHVSDSVLDDYSSKLMGQSEGESILSNVNFENFKSNQKDLNVFLSLEKLITKQQMAMITSQMSLNMKDNYVNLFVSFDKDEISTKLNFVYNDDIKELYEKYSFIKKSLNKDLLKYLPANNYASLGFAINLKEYYKWAMTMPQYKNILSSSDKSSPIKIDELLDAINGDVLIALHGADVAEGDETGAERNTSVNPLVSIVVSMNNDKVYNKITTQLMPPGMFQKKDDVYHGSFFGKDVFFGLFDNNLIVTNDPKVVNNASKGGFPDNLGDTEVAEVLTNPTSLYINLDWSKYPESLKNVVSKQLNNSEKEKINSFSDITKDLEFFAVDNKNAEMHFKLKNIEDNSLHSILQLIDENR